MSDKLTNLKAELAKEKAICDGANPSKYHKERFAELKKQVADLEKKPQPKKEETTTVEEVEVVESNNTEEVTVS
jgi:hypothetical protein